METLKNKTLKGISWSLLDKLLNQVINFILLVYLSRLLSPADFGLIAMLAIFLAISQSLIDTGFMQALIQKSAKVTEYDFNTVFYINIIFSIILYSVMYFLAPFIAKFFNHPELIDLSRVLFAVILINATAIVPRTKFFIAIDFKSQALINTTAMIISSLVAIVMANQSLGYWALVGLNLSRSLTLTVLFFFFSKWQPKLVFSMKSFKEMFTFGANLTIAGLISGFVQNLYFVFIGRFHSSTQIGYYQQGYNYINVLYLALSSIFHGVTYPVLASIKEDRVRFTSALKIIMEGIMLISFPFFVGIAAISKEFVLVFLGEKWEPIIPLITIFSFSKLINVFSAFNLNMLNVKGRSDLFLKAELYTLPVSILILYLAIPYGIIPVAYAFLLTSFISFFVYAYYPSKLLGFTVKYQLKSLIPFAVISIIMYSVISLIHFDNLIIQMLVKIISGIGIYIACCHFFRIKIFTENVYSILTKFKNLKG